MWLENISNNCQRLLRFPRSKTLQVAPCEVQDGTSGEMSVFPSVTTDITQINSLCWNMLLVHKSPSRTTRCQMIGCADWGGCWPGATEQVRTAPPPTYSSGCRLIAGNLTVVTIQGGNLTLTHSEEPPTAIHIHQNHLRIQVQVNCAAVLTCHTITLRPCCRLLGKELLIVYKGAAKSISLNTTAGVYWLSSEVVFWAATSELQSFYKLLLQEARNFLSFKARLNSIWNA